MKRMRERSHSTICLVVSFFLLWQGCASYKPYSYPQLRPDETPYHKVSGKIKAGVLPLVNQERMSQFFEKNLRKEDVLPVLLTFDNADASSYELNTSEIKLIAPDGKELKRLSFDRVYGVFRKSVGARFFGGFLGGAATAAATLLILLPAIVIMPVMSVMNAKEVNRQIKNDIREKAFADVGYLHPHSTQQGFVFFDWKEGRDLTGSLLKINGIRSTRGKDSQPVDIEVVF